MTAVLRKSRFYCTLYATRLGLGRARFAEIAKEPLTRRPAEADYVPSSLHIHFWVPYRTPGANVIVYDMLPALDEEVRAAGLDWRIQAGATLPSTAVDWLVCFKAVPDAAQVAGQPRSVLLICDQPECFWDQLDRFDAVVATASRTLAALLARAHPRVLFLGETEPLEYLEVGMRNLATPPARRGNVLLWHGGAYSLGPLLDLRSTLEMLAETRDIELHVVGGQSPPRDEQWGRLMARFLPWSKKQLLLSAARARLGFAPARASLRLSWLKPGSRVRCLHALGVPAIGDARVPDAAEFLNEFGGPVASDTSSWARLIGQLWDSPDRLERLAAAGHAAVAARHSTRQAARQWIRYFARPTPEVC